MAGGPGDHHQRFYACVCVRARACSGCKHRTQSVCMLMRVCGARTCSGKTFRTAHTHTHASRAGPVVSKWVTLAVMRREKKNNKYISLPHPRQAQQHQTKHNRQKKTRSNAAWKFPLNFRSKWRPAGALANTHVYFNVFPLGRGTKNCVQYK